MMKIKKCECSVLHLVLKKKWYDMIASGEKREEYREVITLLKRGYSIRNTARFTGSSISIVQRIKNQFIK